MNTLQETIQQSLLDLVSSAIAFLPGLVIALLILVITRCSVRPIRRLIRSLAERLTDSTSLQSLCIQLCSVAIWLMGIVLACIFLFPDLRLGDLVALLGLGSVAVGFAFQDIFKNFLAGILLLLNEPFQIGDQIIVDGYEGTVEAIDIRSTAIRTYQGELIIIPNAVVFTNPVQVLTNRCFRRTDLEIGLDYSTPLPQAVQVLSTALKDVEGILENPAPEVDVVGFGDSAIDLVVRYWTAPTMRQIREVRSRVVIALKQACDTADLNIPFPIRTVYFSNTDSNTDQKIQDSTANTGPSEFRSEFQNNARRLQAE
jgi:small conductance mechanosensitive channel